MNANSLNDKNKVRSNFQSPNSYHQPEAIEEINEDDISKTILQRNQRLGTNPFNQIVEQAKKGKGKQKDATQYYNDDAVSQQSGKSRKGRKSPKIPVRAN